MLLLGSPSTNRVYLQTRNYLYSCGNNTTMKKTQGNVMREMTVVNVILHSFSRKAKIALISRPREVSRLTILAVCDG